LIAIALVSLLGWTLIAWKWLALWHERTTSRRWAEAVVGHLSAGERGQALRLCARRDQALARLLHAALSADEPKRRFFEQRIQPLLHSEATALRRHLNTVAVAAAIAPLLGLLGTVVGMVETFDVLTAHGVVIERMARGIGKALITTQAGLLLALPLLLLHHWLSGQVEQRIAMMRLYVKKVETIRCHD
jgi:biopolymer transport protein ExbB